PDLVDPGILVGVARILLGADRAVAKVPPPRVEVAAVADAAIDEADIQRADAAECARSESSADVVSGRDAHQDRRFLLPKRAGARHADRVLTRCREGARADLGLLGHAARIMPDERAAVDIGRLSGEGYRQWRDTRIRRGDRADLLPQLDLDAARDLTLLAVAGRRAHEQRVRSSGVKGPLNRDAGTCWHAVDLPFVGRGAVAQPAQDRFI